MDKNYLSWEGGESICLGQLDDKDSPKTKDQYANDFKLGPKNIYHITQLLHWPKQPSVLQKAAREITNIEDMFSNGDTNKALSRLYRALENNIPRTQLTYVKKWKKDLGLELSETDWILIWRPAAKSSICLQ